MKGFVQTHTVLTRTLTLSEEDIFAFRGILQNTTTPRICVIGQHEIDLAERIATILNITRVHQTEADKEYQSVSHGNVFRKDF